MSKLRATIFAAMLALAAGLGSVAHGESGHLGYPSNGTVAIGYEPDYQQAAFRSSRGVADSTSVSTLTSGTTTRVSVFGKPNIAIGARFYSASQTCVVYLLLENKDGTVYDRTPDLTLTGGTTTDSAGLYMAPAVVFDGAGAVYCVPVLKTAPTANTVDLWVGTR